MWLYGSGFPKSMNIGLALDKKEGLQGQRGVGGFNVGGIQEQQNRKAKLYIGSVTDGSKQQAYTDYKSDLAKQWEGWGTQLKPSYEPVIVARKPVKGSIVENVIENGVGGINIDECRVSTNGELIDNHKTAGTPFMRKAEDYKQLDRTKSTDGRFPSNTMLTYDETDYEEVCGGFPDTKNTTKTHIAKNSNNNVNFNASKEVNVIGYEDSGSASRYFKNCEYNNKDEEIRRYYYCAKASVADRDEGLDNFKEQPVRVLNATNPELENKDDVSERFITVKKNIHPTVKPTELMQYLVRLVTPKGGTILDPFNGSGSTGKAVAFENRERNANYKYIGIELSEDYCDISRARIQWASNDYVYINNEEASKEDIEKIKRANSKSKGIRLW